MSTTCVVRESVVIGGPVDGLVRESKLHPAPFVVFLMQPAMTLVQQMWRRMRVGQTIAIYELHEGDGDVSYRYVGSQVAKKNARRGIAIEKWNSA